MNPGFNLLTFFQKISILDSICKAKNLKLLDSFWFRRICVRIPQPYKNCSLIIKTPPYPFFLLAFIVLMMTKHFFRDHNGLSYFFQDWRRWPPTCRPTRTPTSEKGLLQVWNRFIFYFCEAFESWQMAQPTNLNLLI